MKSPLKTSIISCVSSILIFCSFAGIGRSQTGYATFMYQFTGSIPAGPIWFPMTNTADFYEVTSTIPLTFNFSGPNIALVIANTNGAGNVEAINLLLSNFLSPITFRVGVPGWDPLMAATAYP